MMKKKKENGMSKGQRIRQLAAKAKAKRIKKEKEIAKKENKKLAMLFQRLASSLYKEALANIKEDAKEGEVESYLSLRDLGREPYLAKLHLSDLDPYLDKPQQKKVADLLVKKLEADGFNAKAKWEVHNCQDMTDESHSEAYFAITIKF
jgi:hypothetical protein